MLALSCQLLNEFISRVKIGFGFALNLGVFAHSVFGIGKHDFQLQRRSARLRRVSLVDNHGEIFARNAVDFLQDDGKFLQRGHDNPHAPNAK